MAYGQTSIGFETFMSDTTEAKCVCVSFCTTVVHNTAQSSSDYLPSYPTDEHQNSDAVYWREGDNIKLTITLKPGLVASYHLRPGNRTGLF